MSFWFSPPKFLNFPLCGEKRKKHQFSAFIIGLSKSRKGTTKNMAKKCRQKNLAASTTVSFETLRLKNDNNHTSFSGIAGKGFTHLES